MKSENFTSELQAILFRGTRNSIDKKTKNQEKRMTRFDYLTKTLLKLDFELDLLKLLFTTDFDLDLPCNTSYSSSS